MRDVLERTTEPDFPDGPEQELRYNFRALENMKKVSSHANIVNTYGEFDVVKEPKNQPALPMNLNYESRLPEREKMSEPEQKRFKYVYEEVENEFL